VPEVEKVRTRESAADTESRFANAWSSRFGESIRPEVLRLLMALWDLETAGGQSMFNFNHGNVISTRHDTEPFYFAKDRSGDVEFRAYSNAEAGALGLVQQVTSTTRPMWHRGLLTGDPVAFSQHLKGQHGGPQYYEQDFDIYTATLVRRWEKYPHLVGGGQTEPPDAAKPDGGVAPRPLPKDEAPDSYGSSPAPDSGQSLQRFSRSPVGLPNVEAGQHGEAVAAAQVLAGQLLVDGLFGPLTHSRITEFQEAHGLTVDGKVGAQTWPQLIMAAHRVG